MESPSPASYERKVEAIVEVLGYGGGRRHTATLLIGAGCSVTAGIPLAAEFVRLIEDEFPDAYGRAESKTYASCMAELDRGIRHNIIAERIDTSKVNWAHVAIAQLVKEGHVDRVLTTNFDPLVARACALIGEYPATYDFANSQLFRPERVAAKSVFHVHGQRDGFVLLNTLEECRAHAERLGPLFQDAGRGRTWIVVGYSGENDPVFELLSQVPKFENGLYWIGYKDEDPPGHVSERLLTANKSAYFVRGYDADSFFVRLAQKLGCFPPVFVERPFTFLKDYLSQLSDFTLPGTEISKDVLERSKTIIMQAINIYEEKRGLGETNDEAIDHRVLSMLMAGRYQEIQELHVEGWALDRLRPTIALAYLGNGYELSEQAKTKSGEAADRLFAKARAKYQAALEINPDLREALFDQSLGQSASRISGSQPSSAVASSPGSGA